MTKANTTSIATPSHAMPVKATTGKLVVKDKFLHVGEEPLVTPPKQPSPAPVLTGQWRHQSWQIKSQVHCPFQQCRQQRGASLISSSQLTTTTTAKQSNSSNLMRALSFGNLPITAKKEPHLINFCDYFDVKTKCLKYLADASYLPVGQESQLTFLLNNLKVQGIQMAFIKLITIVGGFATTSFFSNALKESKISERLPTPDLRSQIHDD
jgi:hypothetical protein